MSEYLIMDLIMMYNVYKYLPTLFLTFHKHYQIDELI